MESKRWENGRPGRGKGKVNDQQSAEHYSDLDDPVVDVKQVEKSKGRQQQNQRSTNGEKRDRLKATMLRLIVSDSKQLMVRETLQQVTGKPFKHKQKNDYIDTGENLGRHYWMEDKQLQVYGVIKAKTDEELSPEQLTRQFAVKRLESYGFHSTYCEKALDLLDGDVGKALEHLQTECFGSPKNYLNITEMKLTDIEQLAKEQRLEEKTTLEAIYDQSFFHEVITDRIWLFTISPPYLSKYCRNHSVDRQPVSLNLEIRFPPGSLYPFEPPVVCVSLANNDAETGFPAYLCLNITRRLLDEARENCKHHSPSIFSLLSLLENESDMQDSLQSRPLPYSLQASNSVIDEVFTDSFRGDPNLFQRRRGENLAESFNELLKINQTLKKKFSQKTSSPNYERMQEYRKTLPAWNHQNKVKSTVATCPVVVVSGMTGCGKSTQVPQFLLDEFLTADNQSHCYIICTQPRRISATAVAQRVADERDEKIGQTVGYQIRLETKMSSSTRLLFCTTGVLLRRLEEDSTLKHITHIIVDEVHERSEESDFLLLILRDLLPTRPDLRVILMSATLNSSLFSDYFGNVPVVEIPGRTFPVEQIFLEDTLEKINYVLEEGSPYCKPAPKSLAGMLDKKVLDGEYAADSLGQDEWLLMKEGFGNQSEMAPAKNYVRDEDLKSYQVVQRYARCSDRVQRLIASLDHVKINYDLIECLIEWIIDGDHEYPREGSVLVFLPGIAEISTLYDQLKRNLSSKSRAGRLLLVPLHSSLSNEEQSLIFSKPKPGVRKVVIGTNLAETSITIDDCVFVIDSGRMKENRYDPNKHMDSLDTVWVSIANALQRRGRAGRVRPGVCFHLYTSHRYQYQLAAQPPPEIHLVSLERVILRCKTLPLFGQRPVKSILDRLIEPPSNESVEGSMERLQYLGALDSRHNLTPFGCHLASLPVDLRVGKLMLFGAIFRCVDSALTIAAVLSYKSPFTSPWKQRDEAQRKKLEWSVSQSDHLTVLKVFKAWQEACHRSKKAGYRFAEENFLSIKTLEMITSLKQQFVELLSSIGFLPAGLSRSALLRLARDSGDGVLQATGPKMNVNGDNHPLLLSVLCASLYPHLVRVLRPEHRYNQCSAGSVPAAPRPQQLKFLTKSDGTVSIHPSSVLFSRGNFDSPYIVYHEKIKTSRVFIRECSMAPAFPLILCGGSEIHVSLHRGTFVLGIDDGWIKFICDSHEVAELLAALRAELNALLADKIRDPTLDLCQDQRSDVLLATIAKLITNPSAD